MNSTCSRNSSCPASPSCSAYHIQRWPHSCRSPLTLSSAYLEGLCDHLYDHLRPRILHEPSLEVLCGVCTVLQALMVQDVDAFDDDETAIYSPGTSTPGLSPFGDGAGSGDYFSLSPRDPTGSFSRLRPSFRQASRSSTPKQYPGSILTRPRREKERKRKPLSRLHTEVLLKMVLQDAQTRLVFRAQALISADVQYYAAKDGDLDYPAKLPSGESRPLPT